MTESITSISKFCEKNTFSKKNLFAAIVSNMNLYCCCRCNQLDR